MKGITCASDIRVRCKVEHKTGCWHWKGGVNSAGLPSLWFPPLRKTMSIGQVICYLKTGKLPGRTEVWRSVCGTKHCCNPAHREKGSRADSLRGIKHSDITRMRMSLVKRKKTTAADIEALRNGTMTVKEAVQRLGITLEHAYRLKSYGRGLAVIPGASIFASPLPPPRNNRAHRAAT